MASTVGAGVSATQPVTTAPSTVGTAVNKGAAPVTGTVDTVTTQAGGAVATVVPPVTAPVDPTPAAGPLPTVAGSLTTAAPGLTGTLTSAVPTVVGPVMTAVPTVTNTLTGTVGVVTTGAAPVTGAVTNGLTSATQSAVGTATQVTGGMTATLPSGTASQTRSSVTQVVTGALPIVTQPTTSAINGTLAHPTQALASTLQAATGTIRGIGSPSSTGALPNALQPVISSVGGNVQVLTAPVLPLQPVLSAIPPRPLVPSLGSPPAVSGSSTGAPGIAAPGVAPSGLGRVGLGGGGSRSSHFAASPNGVRPEGSRHALRSSAAQADLLVVPPALTNAGAPTRWGTTLVVSGLSRSLGSPRHHTTDTAGGTGHPVPPAQRAPLGAGESSSGGAPGLFFLLFAAILASLGLGLPAMGRRLRMIRERGAPLAFVLVLDRPG